MRLKRLPQSFYSRSTLNIAEELVGAILVDTRPAIERRLRIVEVEAYIGEDDPACHASSGRTTRNEVMYGPPGFAYIYFIYGMYHCLNIVTEPQGYPAAVLIRAAEPLSGELEINPRTDAPYIPDGPGKLSLALGLNLRHNGLDLVGGAMYVADRIARSSDGAGPARIETSSRIGISTGLEQKWRFFDPDSKFVSGKRSAKNKS